MINYIYSSKDATLYNKYPYKNSGQDSIIELTKTVGTGSNHYISRILIKFDLTSLQSDISSGKVTNPRYYLNLYTSEAAEIPLSYTVRAYAVSQSWEMGIGKEDDNPQTMEGVSWYYRDGSTTATSWATASAATGSEYYKVLRDGGGAWYTASFATQSFEYQSSDIRMDVTNIVNMWVSGTIPNDGFIVKWSAADEIASTELGSIKFFSRDSHTIYQPKLEIAWDNSSFVTGSLTALTDDDTITVYMKNFQEKYNLNEHAKIRVIGRDAYPRRTYSTSSVYTTVTKYLPSSSYYAIYDAHSEQPIIPFDTTYTKLSCDANGNYFNVWMDGLSPERYYRIKIKSDFGNTIKFFDNRYIFKVVR